jgi:tetratricopeptide (TPR) repeat protein
MIQTLPRRATLRHPVAHKQIRKKANEALRCHHPLSYALVPLVNPTLVPVAESIDMATLQTIKSQTDRGVKALTRGDRSGAIDAFQEAFDGLDDVPNMRERRDEYALLGTMFIKSGAPDRALLAARAAVELDEALNDRNLLGQDILMCGTAIWHMGNIAGAIDAYRDAHRIFVEDQSWANAASANTNIAILVGQKDIVGAINLLEESLFYLDRAPFPDTEIKTRIALIQALVVDKRPPQRVFEVAQLLFARFWGRLRSDQKENSVGPLDDAIARHLAANPVADPTAWKAKRFPEAYG